ncbi:hypothetical protein V6N13_087485 [Hibiscus sabdariffa]
MNEETVTLYVKNLNQALHWKGLWHVFGRHGDVVDAFISRKRNCRGRRFGFVRFNGRAGAERTTERLNGFSLYGSKLFVSRAKFNPRTSFWRKMRQEPKNVDKKNASIEAKEKSVGDIEDGIPQGVKTLKRISGHVVEEDLRNCKRCLVGTINTVCSTSSIKSRLQEWGFEVFTEVKFWSENITQRDRATWLEVSGLPLHCWNHTTLKRIAEIWGAFEALGENAYHTLDCEKVSVLITTEQLGIINEVIEVEVNSMVYRVRVLKIGFKDDTRSVSIMKKGQEVVNQNVSHQAESSSERSRSSSPELTEKQLPLTEDFNAMFLGKERNEECFYEAMILNRHMGE